MDILKEIKDNKKLENTSEELFKKLMDLQNEDQFKYIDAMYKSAQDRIEAIHKADTARKINDEVAFLIKLMQNNAELKTKVDEVSLENLKLKDRNEELLNKLSNEYNSKKWLEKRYSKYDNLILAYKMLERRRVEIIMDQGPAMMKVTAIKHGTKYPIISGMILTEIYHVDGSMSYSSQDAEFSMENKEELFSYDFLMELYSEYK